MKTIRRYFDVLLSMALLMAALWLICSCSTVKYVPVENANSDSVYIYQLERDSIFVKDSVFVQTVADTVYHTRVQWKHAYHILRDTVRVAKSDTTTVVKLVEKDLTRWQQAKMSVGGYAIVCSAILVAIWFAKRLKGL